MQGRGTGLSRRKKWLQFKINAYKSYEINRLAYALGKLYMKNIGFVIKGSLVWVSGEVLFPCVNWSRTLSLMVTCLSPLIQNPCGEVVGYLRRNCWFLAGYPRKPLRWTDRRNMTTKNIEIGYPYIKSFSGNESHLSTLNLYWIL